MRVNQFIAAGSSLSRRAADQAIAAGRVLVNGQTPSAGQQITSQDVVTPDGEPITPDVKPITIMLNKPRGYVGQPGRQALKQFATTCYRQSCSAYNLWGG